MNLQERKELVERLIKRRIETAYPTREAVVERLSSTEKLTLYVGIDPTGVDLHLGHTIPLLVMRDIADLGHDVVLLIGDFTARIGDPTGKHSARVLLSIEDIEANMSTYVRQVEKILKPGTFRVVYNSEWLGSLTMSEILRLTGMVTVQQMIQRDMFQERLKAEKPIYLNEFLYPLMQGYDSVALRTDGEVGGNDQTFNMLVGRELEREILGKDKLVLATRLLVDASSGKKMSKSEGTLISVNDSAQEIRRKVLAIDDGMTRTLFELCTDVVMDEQELTDPREAKERLAAELIRMYQGDEAVDHAQEAIEIEMGKDGLLLPTLHSAGAIPSLTEGKNFVKEGAIRVNDVVLDRWDVPLKSGDEIRIGKGKFLKVK